MPLEQRQDKSQKTQRSERPANESKTDLLRLFIALEIPFSVQNTLRSLQEQVKQEEKSVSATSGHGRSEGIVRWTAIESIHITLKFLGETPTHKQPAIETALHEATKDILPFTLSLNGVGCFPDYRKPRVVWAGCGGDLDMLHRLRDAVEETIAPLGYPTENRPFSPHLTIGRVKSEAPRSAVASLGERISRLNTRLATTQFPIWELMRVHLMRSDLKPSGAVYTSLYKVDFTSPQP